jgi:hypothetical protein
VSGILRQLRCRLDFVEDQAADVMSADRIVGTLRDHALGGHAVYAYKQGLPQGSRRGDECRDQIARSEHLPALYPLVFLEAAVVPPPEVIGS